MSDYFRHLLRGSRNNLVLTNLRERLLKVMLFSSCILGTLLFVTALIPVYQRDYIATIVFYAVVYAWILQITFVPRLP